MKKSIQMTEFKDLNLIGRGKVRDIYSVKNYLLIVTTDRISAFDVIMPNPVPEKGIILNRMSAFWFDKIQPSFPKNAPLTVKFWKAEACWLKKPLRCPLSVLSAVI